jgi:hypothetical protein
MRCGLIAWIALPLALMLLASGCGGDDGGSGGTRTAARDIQPQAQAKAESMVLQLSDFPNGWRASPSEDTQDGNEEFYECLGVDFSEFTITGDANSQDFAMGESAEASSEAAVLQTAQDAALAMDEYSSGMTSQTAEDCVSDLLVRAIRENDPDQEYEIGEIDLGELGFTPPDIQEGRAWQIAIPFEVQGVSETVYLELAFLRQGTAVATVETQDVSEPFDPTLRDDLLEAVAARMSEPSS